VEQAAWFRLKTAQFDLRDVDEEFGFKLLYSSSKVTDRNRLHE
jgi:hypothetical protein